MKYFIAVLLLAVSCNATLNCGAGADDIKTTKEWIDQIPSCVEQIRSQIQTEVNASITYLAMGAHFARDTINRPGFSEFFFKAAGEEREHATKLIEYLLMRGSQVAEKNELSTLITVNAPDKIKWDSGVEALRDALQTEVSVTKRIRELIKACEEPRDKNERIIEGGNDWHFVDYLTGEFLEEQYQGQRDLAGKISTLAKMTDAQGEFGEFLFDKRLLE